MGPHISNHNWSSHLYLFHDHTFSLPSFPLHRCSCLLLLIIHFFSPPLIASLPTHVSFFPNLRITLLSYPLASTLEFTSLKTFRRLFIVLS
ncbi:hypothetical protein BDN71DRAFT_1298926 [Pleurotus eryngii]|uniref:Uncharacterized protein n=1 Tax=Pleurotus eryngii TaxID=5323 RepID=A0A9P5ZR24_PLEER|nr:hypothetical protein BDN71DRAFT_1298926 [Pleurotus eryngii]